MKERVKYLYHICNDFINPYGLAHNSNSFGYSKLAARLKRLNCEFLVRLTIAPSKSADTVLKDADYINGNLQHFNMTHVPKFLQKLEPLYPHLKLLKRRRQS